METAPKQSLKWLSFYPEDYAHLLCASDRELAYVFKDLITVGLSGKMEDSEVMINQKMLEQTMRMWEQCLNTKKRQSQIAKEKFNRAKPERPTREVVLQFAKEIGAEHADIWYDIITANDWRDGEGYPIRNWSEALRLFEIYAGKFYENAVTAEVPNA